MKEVGEDQPQGNIDDSEHDAAPAHAAQGAAGGVIFGDQMQVFNVVRHAHGGVSSFTVSSIPPRYGLPVHQIPGKALNVGASLFRSSLVPTASSNTWPGGCLRGTETIFRKS